MSRHYPRRVSPFRNPRIKACLAAPRGLSQLATSFIASQHQGIHRLPLIAWPQNNKHNHAVLLYWRLISISKLSKSNFKWPLGQMVKLSISLFLRLTDHWQFNKSTKVVEVNGFEPMASCVQGRRSPSWATPPKISRILDCGFWIFYSTIQNLESEIQIRDGGPGWSWTIDLTLIRRAL